MANRATHVIFDLDGLLLNTEDLYTEAFNKLLEKHGQRLTWDVKSKMMGRTPKTGYQILIEEMGLPKTVEQVEREMNGYLEEVFPHSSLMPGARRLIKHLYIESVPMALCSGSTRHYYELKTAEHEHIFELLHHCVFAPDDPEVTRGKPDPQCYEVCSRRFSPPPERPSAVLVFEDSPNGVEAALRAGMQVVMVPDSHVSVEERNKATLCVESLLSFQPELFGLPRFRK